jgi:hypothetical protein
VTDALDKTEGLPYPPRGGDAGPSQARLREVVRQIEALRNEPDPSNFAAAGGETASAPGAGGASGEASDRLSQRAAREIERLRAMRARRTKDLAITGIVAATRKQAADVHRRLGELIELWDALVPAEIADHTRLTALRGGVLHVAVDSSAIAYELDRLLREGLLVTLRQRHRRTLARVKVTLAPTNESQH